MAASQVSQWRVTPGRVQEFNALASDAKKILERHGGRCRMFNALGAGPNANIRSFVWEVDDLEAWGRLTTALAADAEWQTYLPKLFSADPAATLVASSIVNEVPI